MDDNKKDEIQDKEKLNNELLADDNSIEKEIDSLNNTLDGKLTEEDKDNIRKILRYIGVMKKKSRFEIFISNTRKYLFNLIGYIIVYFALFGMMQSVISYEKNLFVVIFILILSFYQVLFKELLENYLRPGKPLYMGIFIFICVSIFIVHEFLDVTGLLIFRNFFYLTLFYILGEFINYMLRYYISKHLLENILR